MKSYFQVSNPYHEFHFIFNTPVIPFLFCRDQEAPSSSRKVETQGSNLSKVIKTILVINHGMEEIPVINKIIAF